MSDQSARLSLPYVMPAQAQKHVTVNEAFTRLDRLVQLVLEATGAETPPLAPEPGQVWALGPAPDGAWTGHGGELASWDPAGWQFLIPAPGWTAVQAGQLLVWDGTAWAPAPVGDLDGLPGLGIGTSHDATNRLAVRAEASLLTHDGGGHQLKLNKAAASDTASLLFQTGWSGRAEMGTTGSDAFEIKVSADGQGWTTALRLSGTDGVAEFPAGARAQGAPVYHAGNLLGPVAQAAGQPTGAVIEHGSTASGQFVRFADGTQIVWMGPIDMGSIVAAGSGTWSAPYRTDPVSVTWPAAFSQGPSVSTALAPLGNAGALESRALTLANFELPGPTGWSYLRASRIGDSAHDVDIGLTILAVGRWV